MTSVVLSALERIEEFDRAHGPSVRPNYCSACPICRAMRRRCASPARTQTTALLQPGQRAAKRERIAVAEPRPKVLRAKHIGRPALPLRDETLEPLGVEPAVLGGAIHASLTHPYAKIAYDSGQRIRLRTRLRDRVAGASPDRGREFLLVVPQQIGLERD